MSLSYDYTNAINAARHNLLARFHDLREILWDNNMPHDEKSKIFVNQAQMLMDMAIIARPDLTVANCDNLQPVGYALHHCTYEALEKVLETLDEILDYRRYMAELRIVVDQINDMLHDQTMTYNAKVKAMRAMTPILLKCCKSTGKHTMYMVQPAGVDFNEAHMKMWVDHLVAYSKEP